MSVGVDGRRDASKATSMRDRIMISCVIFGGACVRWVYLGSVKVQ